MHHLYYQGGSEPWDYPMEALTTLCESCHEVEHSYRREAEESLLEVFRVEGFSVSDLDQIAFSFHAAKYPCTKDEFAEAFNYMMETTLEEMVRDYFGDTLPSEHPHEDDEPAC